MLNRIAVASLAFGAVSSPAAAAGSNSASMVVGATILESCTVVAGPMAFGSLTVLGSAHDAEADISLTCTPNTQYDVKLGMGDNASGGSRNMAGLSNSAVKIPYAIYSNSSRTQQWTSSAGETVGGTASGSLVALKAYGRIPASAQTVGFGAYQDVVTVTVEF